MVTLWIRMFHLKCCKNVDRWGSCYSSTSIKSVSLKDSSYPGGSSLNGCRVVWQDYSISLRNLIQDLHQSFCVSLIRSESALVCKYGFVSNPLGDDISWMYAPHGQIGCWYYITRWEKKNNFAQGFLHSSWITWIWIVNAFVSFLWEPFSTKTKPEAWFPVDWKQISFGDQNCRNREELSKRELSVNLNKE